MKPILIAFLFFALGLSTELKGQKIKVAFYNVENLFDTIDNPNTFDDDYITGGRLGFDSERFEHKTEQISSVIRSIYHAQFPHLCLMGFSEVENQMVLNQLLGRHEITRELKIIHRESPDKRGIDVALTYNPSCFELIDYDNLELKIWSQNSHRIYTRDILEVQGILHGEFFKIYVNHWPSRRRGASASQVLRVAAAKKLLSRLLEETENASLLIMGDFNDNPVDTSVEEVLVQGLDSTETQLTNPFETIYKKGGYTLIHGKSKYLFDMILYSSKKLKKANAFIHNAPFLTYKNGNKRGHLKRSFDYNGYLGGFSDHFPVVLTLENP